MNIKIKRILINKINQSLWWHVTPKDPAAYKKRGKFFASTYKQAEFYGRPNSIPERVKVSNPICGTSEINILKALFPTEYKKIYTSVIEDGKDYYKQRIGLDSKMYRRAKSMGYDAIILLGSNANKDLTKNRKPYSIELNLCK